MGLNWPLKQALIEKFGTQIRASREMGIKEGRLSYIIRGHVQPSERERRALENALSKSVFKRCAKGAEHAD